MWGPAAYSPIGRPLYLLLRPHGGLSGQIRLAFPISCSARIRPAYSTLSQDTRSPSRRVVPHDSAAPSNFSDFVNGIPVYHFLPGLPFYRKKREPGCAVSLGNTIAMRVRGWQTRSGLLRICASSLSRDVVKGLASRRPCDVVGQARWPRRHRATLVSAGGAAVAIETDRSGPVRSLVGSWLCPPSAKETGLR